MLWKSRTKRFKVNTTETSIHPWKHTNFLKMQIMSKQLSKENGSAFVGLTTTDKNLVPNDKICGKIAFPRYTKRVKIRSQSRETASKRKPYRGLGTK